MFFLRSEKDIDILNDELAHIIFGERKNPKLWTSVPRSHNSVTFSTALDWAKEVGEAARNGFDVILRTPRVYEFFVDTPVSILEKGLILLIFERCIEITYWRKNDLLNLEIEYSIYPIKVP